MEIRITLDSGGAAEAGIDRSALIDNIQAEVDKLASSAGADALTRTDHPPPEDAQGDLAIIEWLIDVASDPAMAKFYARSFILAVNSVLQAAKSRQPASSQKPKDEKENKDTNNGTSISVKIIDKEFTLPLATSIVKKILEELEED